MRTLLLLIIIKNFLVRQTYLTYQICTNLERGAIIHGHARRSLYRSISSENEEGIECLATGEFHKVDDGHWCLERWFLIITF